MFLSVLQPKCKDHIYKSSANALAGVAKEHQYLQGEKSRIVIFFVWWFSESNFNLVLPYQSFLPTNFDIHSLSSRHHYHHCWNMKNKGVLVYCINYGNCSICEQVHNYLSYFKDDNQINMTWLKIITKKLNLVNHVKSNTFHPLFCCANKGVLTILITLYNRHVFKFCK